MEDLVLLSFIAFVAAVFLLAALAVVRILLRRFGWLAAPSRAHVWMQRVVLTFALAGLLCMAYGYFIEPYWLSTTRVRVETAKLPRGTRPIRLIHISDLHSDPQVRLEERLPKVIAAERPDLIVFTGDSINSPDGLPVLRNCLTRLAQIAPTFVVKGNWDAWFWRGQKLFEETGVRELKNEAVKLDVGGASIWIAGTPVGGEHKFEQIFDAIPPDAFSIFLYHYPDLINEVAAKKVDLYCAGHTHGGQVALPLYGALITLSKFGKRYESGLYRVDRTHLYVNRGIGMEGGLAPRVRFWARPEVTVIEIAPQ